MEQGGWGRQPVLPRLCPLPLAALGLVDRPSCSPLTPGGMSRLTHTHFGGSPAPPEPLSGRAGSGSAALRQNSPGSAGGGRGGCCRGAGQREAGGRQKAVQPRPRLPAGPGPVAVQRLRAAAGEEQAERGGSRAGDAMHSLFRKRNKGKYSPSVQKKR